MSLLLLMKFQPVANTRPAKAGWVASTPVSMMAMTVPAPVVT